MVVGPLFVPWTSYHRAMRLLLTTQAIDLDDPIHSTYHDWVAGLAGKFESVEAVCLAEGRHTLPSNVSVHTLGKHGLNGSALTKRIIYAWRLLRFAWTLRDRYDAVFVHMNEEYLVIAGWVWRLMGKRVFMWRNHYAGTFLTDLDAFWCHTTFCTSRFSYTAKYKKNRLMPVGVELSRFHAQKETRIPRSILSLSRIAPSKRLEMLLDALGMLHEAGIPFTASIVGSPLEKYEPYHRMLQAKASALSIEEQVTFLPGIPNVEAAAAYARHEYFVNCSPSGMYDKTLFEAAASGCIVLATSEDFKDAAGGEFWFHDATTLFERLRSFLSTTPTPETYETLRTVANDNSFDRLMNELEKGILTP